MQIPLPSPFVPFHACREMLRVFLNKQSAGYSQDLLSRDLSCGSRLQIQIHLVASLPHEQACLPLSLNPCDWTM